MNLPDGYHRVPSAKLAAVVTYLGMHAAPPRRAGPAGESWALRRISTPGSAWYRELFGRIGRDHLWASRHGAAGSAAVTCR